MPNSYPSGTNESRRRCNSCRNFEVTHEETIVSFSELAKSSKNGCMGCDFVCRVITRWLRRNELSVLKDTSFVEIFRSISTKSLCIRFGLDPIIQLEVYAIAEHSQPWSSFRVMSDISGDTSSDSSFNRAVHWLDECRSKHVLCNTSPRSQKMPRRLLDITSDKPRLLEDHGLMESYVCLSHCWGGYQPLRTTIDTIQQHKIEIAWDSIPKTFQDAMQVAKRLHIYYIWIDSLCIVQDDPDDWAAQSAEMANIYSGAFLTIAATCAPNSSHGLFSKAPDIYLPEKCNFTALDGKSYPLHVRHSSKFHMMESQEGDFAHGWFSNDWPLLKRAWVFQERLLSPRLLHFGADELVWECRQGSNCECSGIHAGQYFDSQSKSYFADYMDVFHFHLKRRFTGAEGNYSTWHDVVQAYTGLQISFKKDIFPALSGIAQRTQAKRKTRYVAGLWEDSLFRDLLWHTTERKKRPEAWRAPSWSWASIDTTIFFHPFGEAHATLLEAESAPLSIDHFGELQSACITLQGWIFHADVLNHVHDRCSFKIVALEIDTSSGSILFDDDAKHPGELRFLKIASVYLTQDDPRHNPSHHAPYYTYYFLVLTCLDCHQPVAVFERAGLASLDLYEPLPEDHSDILGSQDVLKVI